jgi:hypothetical protein
MDLEPTLEEMGQASGVSESDSSTEIDSSDEEMAVEDEASCECERSCCDKCRCHFKVSMDGSISCGCALCRLYCMMYCLARIGPALWHMDRGEVKTQLLELRKNAPFNSVYQYFWDYGWTIFNGQSPHDFIQFFQKEGMHHLPIQRKPLLIFLQHIRPCETYLFSNHFLNLLVLIRAFGLRKSGWKPVWRSTLSCAMNLKPRLRFQNVSWIWVIFLTGSGYWKTQTRLHPIYACLIAGVMRHSTRCGRHLRIYPVTGGEYRLLIYPKLFGKQQ